MSCMRCSGNFVKASPSPKGDMDHLSAPNRSRPANRKVLQPHLMFTLRVAGLGCALDTPSHSQSGIRQSRFRRT